MDYFEDFLDSQEIACLGTYFTYNCCDSTYDLSLTASGGKINTHGRAGI